MYYAGFAEGNWNLSNVYTLRRVNYNYENVRKYPHSPEVEEKYTFLGWASYLITLLLHSVQVLSLEVVFTAFPP